MTHPAYIIWYLGPENADDAFFKLNLKGVPWITVWKPEGIPGNFCGCGHNDKDAPHKQPFSY